MKTTRISLRYILHIAVCLLVLFCASAAQAANISATGSGNWDSIVADAPWPGGIVPQLGDNVTIGAGFTVTVAAPAACAALAVNGTGVCQNDNSLTVAGNISGSGSLIQGAAGDLHLGGVASGIAVLNAAAVGNTVSFTGNAGGQKATTYHNLNMSGFGTFFNGSAMAINGNVVMSGTTGVQQGGAITIGGNLDIGVGTKWDPSCNALTVSGNTTIGGTLEDGCGDSANLVNSLHNVTVLAGGTWRLTDVQQWGVSGNLTCDGNMTGSSGRVTLTGTGTVSGSSVNIPNLSVTGTYTVGATVTVTNTPTLHGTLTFDIAQPYMLVVPAHAVSYDGGNLTMINTGAAPGSGSSYQLFSATSYTGLFASITFVPLGGGLNWVDNLNASGSVAVSGDGGGGGPTPTLAVSRSGNELTFSWDSNASPGYTLQMNNTGIASNTWNDAPNGSTSPVPITIDPSGTPVFFRLYKPL